MWVERLALGLSFSVTFLLTSCAYYWPASEDRLAEIRIVAFESADLSTCEKRGRFYVHLNNLGRPDYGNTEPKVNKFIRRITSHKGGDTAAITNGYAISSSGAPGMDVEYRGYVYRCSQ